MKRSVPVDEIGTQQSAARVLIVEDDEPTRYLLERTLQEARFAVVTTASGRDGLRMLRDDPSIRVVLLDLEIPDLSGWEFRRAQRADKRLAGVPTVIITATDLANIVDTELAAADYLLKPVSPEHLISVVRKYCPRVVA